MVKKVERLKQTQDDITEAYSITHLDGPDGEQFIALGLGSDPDTGQLLVGSAEEIEEMIAALLVAVARARGKAGEHAGGATKH